MPSSILSSSWGIQKLSIVFLGIVLSLSGGLTNFPAYADNFPVLQPGPDVGWSNVLTPQPATLPASCNLPSNTDQRCTAKAIARWDVVPFQDLNAPLNIGVVAFHISDIDHVSFSLNNGPWVNVNQMTLNPTTNVTEYTVTIDPSLLPDGKFEVRAIAYPKVGIPRVLQDGVGFGQDYGDGSLWLNANTHNSLVNSNTVAYVDSKKIATISGVTGVFSRNKLMRGLTSGALAFVEEDASGTSLIFSPWRSYPDVVANFQIGEQVSTASYSMNLDQIQEYITPTNNRPVGWYPGNIAKYIIVKGQTSGATALVLQGTTGNDTGTNSAATLKMMPITGTFVVNEVIMGQQGNTRVQAHVLSLPVCNNDGPVATINSIVANANDATANGTINSPFSSLTKAILYLAQHQQNSVARSTLYLKSGHYVYPHGSLTNPDGSHTLNSWNEYDPAIAWWQGAGYAEGDTWFHIVGAPNVAKDRVILTSQPTQDVQGSSQRWLHIKGVTIDTFNQSFVTIASEGSQLTWNSMYWLDNSEIVGFGFKDVYNEQMSVPLALGGFRGGFFTDNIFRNTSAPQLSQSIVLNRHTYFYDLGGDLYNSKGLGIDVRVNNLEISDRPFNYYTGPHPDVAQILGDMDNVIIYGLQAMDVTAQGLAIGGDNIKNIAFVNGAIKQRASDVEAAWAPSGYVSANHILLWNITWATHGLQLENYVNGAWVGGGQKNFNIKNCVLNESAVHTNIDTSGWVFDNNHYIFSGNPGVPYPGFLGTNSTVSADPGFVDFANNDLRPSATSVLNAANRPASIPVVVGIDVEGNIRGSVSAIGAFKGINESGTLPPVNQAPQVNAGIDQSINLPSTINLAGTVNDDGLPSPSLITKTWSQVSGPSNGIINTPNELETTVSVSLSGTYIFRLTASDGVLVSTDDVLVTVNPLPSYIITVSLSSNNGTVSPSGSVRVNQGANQTFSIIPATGYSIGSLLVDGVATNITGNSYTFTQVSSNHTLSVVFVANPPAALLTPTGVSAVALSNSKIKISWSAYSTVGATGIRIDRANSSSGPWVRIKSLPTTATNYTNNNLFHNTTYYYRVYAYNAQGNSAYSPVVSARTSL